MTQEQRRIIVIADRAAEDSGSTTLAKELAQAGIKKAVKAAGAAAAWKLLRTGSVKLFIARSQVLAEQGCALARKIRTTTTLASLPVVAVLESNGDPLRKPLAQAGIQAFVSSPVSAQALKQAVDKARSGTAGSERPSPGKSVAEAPGKGPVRSGTSQASGKSLKSSMDLLKSGQTAKAARSFASLVKTEPSPESYFGLAKALKLLGQDDRARQALARGRQLKQELAPADFSDHNARMLEEMARDEAASDARKPKTGPGPGKPVQQQKSVRGRESHKQEPDKVQRPSGPEKASPEEALRAEKSQGIPRQQQTPVNKELDAEDPFALAGMAPGPESAGTPGRKYHETATLRPDQVFGDEEDTDPMMRAFKEAKQEAAKANHPGDDGAGSPSPSPSRPEPTPEPVPEPEPRPKPVIPKGKERRRAPRVQLAGLTIHVHKPRGDYPIVDASMLGIAFHAENGFSSGDTLVLDIEDMERVRVRKLKCRVVHASVDKVGCEFSSLSRKQAKLLEELLAVEEDDGDDLPIDMDATLNLDLF